LRAALAAKTLLQSGFHGIGQRAPGSPGQFSRESMDIGIFYVQRRHFPPFFLNSTMVEKYACFHGAETLPTRPGGRQGAKLHGQRELLLFSAGILHFSS
jgi:hypothetical protein